MCHFRSGEALLVDGDLKIVTSKKTDSHTKIREEFGIAEVAGISQREPLHTPIEFIPVRGLLRKKDYDLVFDAGKPSWWKEEYTERARDEMWTAVKELLDLKTHAIVTPGSLDLSSVTSLPANAKLSAGGYLDLSGKTIRIRDGKVVQ